MYHFGRITCEEMLRRIPNLADRETFKIGMELGDDSCYATRVFLIYCLPALDCTSFGIKLEHSAGPMFIDSVTISMVMEALTNTTLEKDLNMSLRAVAPQEGDWRKSRYVVDFLKKQEEKDCGQAKILYSTLVPILTNLDEMQTILVVGSGGAGGGGASYEVVAKTLSMEGIPAVMYLYDKFEVKSVEKMGSVIVNRFDKYYAKGDVGTDANILIDDSFVKGSVSFSELGMPAKIMSLKSFGAGDKQPHYTGTEKRLYVGCNIPQNMVVLSGMDSCSDCVMWSRLLSTVKFSTAEYVWHSAIRMGVVPCAPYDGTKLAHQVGKLDAQLRVTKRFNLDNNEKIDVGYLAISAAINMRSGSVKCYKNQLEWCQRKYKTINAFRTRVSSADIKGNVKDPFDLTPMLIGDKSVAVVALNPSDYLPNTIALVPPEVADIIITSNTLILDELSPLFMILQVDSNRIIEGYRTDECKKINGSLFTRFARQVKRRKSLVVPDIDWEMVISMTVPQDSLNRVISSISSILSNQPMPPGLLFFPKTRKDLLQGLTCALAQQSQKLGPVTNKTCGEIGCVCSVLGPKKPWHTTCSDRTPKISLCGCTPCVCRTRGPKSFIHVSCVDRNVKKICGLIGCRCLYLGPNLKGEVCNRRLR